MNNVTRRTFLAGSTSTGMALALSAAMAPTARAQDGTTAPPSATSAGDGPYGPLGTEPDANGLLLPAGFSSRIVAISGETVDGTDFSWHAWPDGGVCFPADDGGWVYVSNSEVPNNSGGVGAVRFDAQGGIVDAYRILDGTNLNCAGGPTPWGTWLSCEEYDWVGSPPLIEAFGSAAGRVWECDPFAPGQGTVRPALGLFAHEAVAVDPVHERLYLTEDRVDGRFYRFTPDAYPDLSAGVLEAASVEGDRVSWVTVPDPSATDTRLAAQVADSTTAFPGGEGIWYHDGVVYFTSKDQNRVHAIETTTDVYELLYDGSARGPAAPLTGVDNLTVEEGSGDLFVAEEATDMELVMITSERVVAPFVRFLDHDNSEVTGPAFSPDGTRLYLSSQRGIDTSGVGITYEITGPFRGVELRGSAATTTVPSPATTLREVAQAPETSDGGGDDAISPAVMGGGAVVVAGAVAAGVVALRRRGDDAAS